MNLKERKQKLLTNSAKEVRSNKALFDEFVFLYVSEAKDEREKARRNKQCHSCGFQNIFYSWQLQQRAENPIKQVKMSSNTFKLKDRDAKIQIPYTGEVITKNSPDEMVVEYLNQEGGNKQSRIDRWFSEIPESMRPKKAAPKKEAPKAIEKVEEKKVVAKAAPKKKRAVKRK